MTGKTNTAKTLYSLCEAAIFIALATVIALLQFPPFRFSVWIFGGSIDFVMFPLFIMCWRLGLKWSIPACFAFGVVKFLITGYSVSYYGGILAIFLDYVLAYGMVGIAGVFANKKYGLFSGIALGSFARFIVHFISGITIYKIGFGEIEEIFGMTFNESQAAFYSLLYNGSYMLGEFLYCMLIGLLLYKPLVKVFEKLK